VDGRAGGKTEDKVGAHTRGRGKDKPLSEDRQAGLPLPGHNLTFAEVSGLHPARSTTVHRPPKQLQILPLSLPF
jgi:hypothetical protein